MMPERSCDRKSSNQLPTIFAITTLLYPLGTANNPNNQKYISIHTFFCAEHL